jgi:hypothetical protein
MYSLLNSVSLQDSSFRLQFIFFSYNLNQQSEFTFYKLML